MYIKKSDEEQVYRSQLSDTLQGYNFLICSLLPYQRKQTETRDRLIRVMPRPEPSAYGRYEESVNPLYTNPHLKADPAAISDW